MTSGITTRKLRLPAFARLLVAVVSLIPCASLAAWTDFIPTPYENHAWIDLYNSYERDATESNNDITWTDTYLRQRLTLQSIGYSYDPRFVQYQFSLAGAFSEEDYESTAFESGGFQSNAGVEYDARLYFLPEHPYNLQLFASRYEPVFKQQAARQHDSIATTYGTLLRYRRKPYFANANFVDTTLDSGGSSSNTKRLGLDGEYFKRFNNGYEVSVTGAAKPSWYSDSQGLDGSAQEYLLGNFVNLKRVRLSTTLTENMFEQTRDPDQSYDANQFYWWELLSLYLPWDFRSNLSYRYHDSSSDITTARDPDRSYDDQGSTVQFDVIHRLYDSLDTTYRLLSDARESSGGDTDLLSNNLSIDYNKRIPTGRFATGVSLGRTTTDNTGFADVVNDPYTGTSVPGVFALHQQNVEPDSISLLMRSPFPPYETIPLVEGVHYQKNTAVEPIEIQIFSLPAQFVIPGTYDIYVSYSLLGGEFELQTDSLGVSGTIELFHDLIDPYFRYMAIRSDVLSGEFPGIPVDSNSWIGGLRMHYGPLRGLGEYQYLDWDVNPFSSWRTELQYIGNLTRTTSTYSTVSYQNRQYLGGEGIYESPEYTEETISGGATLTQQLPYRDMYLSLGGSYSSISGLVDSTGWSANASFVWRIAKVDISIGVSAYGADTQTDENNRLTSRDREFVFINIRRQLL